MRRAAAVLLLAALAACGKRGDPLPPLRIVPQPVSGLRLEQRGDRLETLYVAPRNATDGSRLGVLEIELQRTTKDGDFDKLAERHVRRVAPGEALVDSEPLPAAGTLVRVAARAVSKGRGSSRAGPVALQVQPPPLAPRELRAQVAATGVVLRWVDPNPPLPEPTPAAPAGVPGQPTPTPGPATPATPTAPAPPAGVAPRPAPSPTPPASPSPTPSASPSPAPPASASPTPASASPRPVPTPPPTPPPPSRGVRIYRRANDGVYSRPLQPVPLTAATFTDDAVQPGEEWCYVARFAAAMEPVVESAPSNEACATFKDVAAPRAPIGVAVVLRPEGVEVSWSPSPEADLAGYRVYRAATPDAPAERIAELGPEQTVLRDPAAKAGLINVYTITAFDKAGNESPASSPVQVRP